MNYLYSAKIPEGWAYVLPTEAQWEYACRAGTSTKYSWGGGINSAQANYNWDGGSVTGEDFKQTRDVGQYAANPWGFYDMHGNVQEWTEDEYAAYSLGAKTDPSNFGNPDAYVYRVMRGGSWIDNHSNLMSAFRNQYNARANNRFYTRGFRIAFRQVE
jgi:formylglycine-generating enzyme required for sulfatase activity